MTLKNYAHSTNAQKKAAVVGAVGIQWGWALLVLGAILILAAAAMSRD